MDTVSKELSVPELECEDWLEDGTVLVEELDVPGDCEERSCNGEKVPPWDWEQAPPPWAFEEVLLGNC